MMMMMMMMNEQVIVFLTHAVWSLLFVHRPGPFWKSLIAVFLYKCKKTTFIKNGYRRRSCTSKIAKIHRFVRFLMYCIITTCSVECYWQCSDGTVHYKSDKTVNFCDFRCNENLCSFILPFYSLVGDQRKWPFKVMKRSHDMTWYNMGEFNVCSKTDWSHFSLTYENGA